MNPISQSYIPLEMNLKSQSESRKSRETPGFWDLLPTPGPIPLPALTHTKKGFESEEFAKNTGVRSQHAPSKLYDREREFAQPQNMTGQFASGPISKFKFKISKNIFPTNFQS